MPGRIDTNRVCTIDEAQARVAGISVEERKAKSQATIPLQRYGTIEDFCKKWERFCSLMPVLHHGHQHCRRWGFPEDGLVGWNLNKC